MRIRTGRKNKHALYIQVGDLPSCEHDIPLGFISNPDVAALLADQASSHPWTVDQILKAVNQ